jgi:hypothetical protein
MNTDGRAVPSQPPTPEDELDRFVDTLVAGRGVPSGASDPDLAGLFATARRVRALREPEWPPSDFPIVLAARLAAALPPGERRTPPPQRAPTPIPLVGMPSSPREPAGRTDATGRAGRGPGAWRLFAAVARRAASVAAVLVLLGVGVGALALVLPRVLHGVAVPQGTIVATSPFGLYVSDAYDGSGLLPIDPRTLADRSERPLLGPDVTRSGSSWMVISPDRGTIAVVAYTSPFDPSGAGITIRVFDARTGTERARFHPVLPVIIDALSTDGSRLIGRDWPPKDLNVPHRVLDATDGRLLATTPAPAPTAMCCITRLLEDPAGGRTYGLLVPGSDGPASGPRVPTLVAWDPRSGRELGRLPLEGILAGFWQTARVVDGRPVGASLDPGLALSPDGRRIAVLSAQEDLLTLIDAEALRVLWTRTVAPQGGGLDWLRLGARSAAAKGEMEGARRDLVFSADGRRLYASGSSTRLDDRGEPMIEPLDPLAIAADDSGGGRVVAAGSTHDIVNWMRVSPDGAALYMCVSPGGGAQPPFIIRRLDPATLTTLAEREFATMPQLHFLAVP